MYGRDSYGRHLDAHVFPLSETSEGGGLALLIGRMIDGQARALRDTELPEKPVARKVLGFRTGYAERFTASLIRFNYTLKVGDKRECKLIEF